MALNAKELRIFIKEKDYYPINLESEENISICLIICNWDFDPADPLKPHEKIINPELQKDAKRLEKRFKNLNYIVILKENMSAKDMITELTDTRRKLDNKKQNSFVCILISHGFNSNATIARPSGSMKVDAESGIISAKNEGLLVVTDIISLFNNENCKNFIGKPKLFFIASCRGDYLSFGASEGSFFGLALDKILEDCENKELTHILTQISTEVQERTAHIIEERQLYHLKQSISWESRGFSKLFFFKISETYANSNITKPGKWYQLLSR